MQNGTRRVSAWQSSCALVAALVAFGQGCSAPDMSKEATGGIRGELSVRIASYPDSTTSRDYFLETGDGQAYLLVFDQAPDLESGTELEIHGDVEAGDVVPRLVVNSYALVDDGSEIGTLEQGLANPTTKSDYSVAVLMVHWGSPDGETVDSMRKKVFTNTDSTSNYFRESSYGIQGLTGDVFGWYSIPNPGGCNTDTISSAARTAATSAGVNLANYKQVMYYFPRYASCGWAGLAVIGSPDKPQRDSWYNGYSGCVVLSQELAHNWGLLHSRSCSALPSSGMCTNYSEYGDMFCPMGGGCWQMNAVQKGEMGWFGKCNIVTANSGGTFDIAPYENPSDGIQALRVPRGDGRYFYIENRTVAGKFDTLRSSSTLNTAFTGVLIHEGPEVQPMPSMDYRNPYLIDTNTSTGTFEDSALQVGRGYTSGNVSISLVSKASNTSTAQVQVTVTGGSGSSLCMDGTVYGSTTPPPPPPPP
ncbi:MAG TPA: hypothetical protein VM686_32465, partial [Polyangiaceae bacterium]|nr:hypothetical protein [Polyangiaceae bacterium]